MGDFDGQAFAAVDAFFAQKTLGVSSERVKTTKAHVSNSTPNKRQRLGVGAASSEDRTNGATGSLHQVVEKRIVQVGAKRNRQLNLEGEVDGHQSVPDDDEEDLGRTAIHSDKSETTKAAMVSAVARARSSAEKRVKKKKKGKKERARERSSGGGATSVAAPVLDSKDRSQETEQQKNDEQDQPRQKKKRYKKVRSRQKNIVKDNRSQKPKHLEFGKDYRGRPLTAATRAKLNLPETRETGGRWESNWNDEDTGVLAGDDEEGGSPVDPKQPTQSRKRKKSSKYKNLV